MGGVVQAQRAYIPHRLQANTPPPANSQAEVLRNDKTATSNRRAMRGFIERSRRDVFHQKRKSLVFRTLVCLLSRKSPSKIRPCRGCALSCVSCATNYIKLSARLSVPGSAAVAGSTQYCARILHSTAVCIRYFSFVNDRTIWCETKAGVDTKGPA